MVSGMGTKYLGACWERFQNADGSIELKRLHVYWVKGESRFALTEEAARAAVVAAGGAP
jgi:hypothetical protein